MERDNFVANTNTNPDSNGEGNTLRSLLTQHQGKGMDEAEVRNLLQWVLPQLASLHQENRTHGNLTLDTIVFQNDQITMLPPDATQPPTTISHDLQSLGQIVVELLTVRAFSDCINASGQLDWSALSSISSSMQQYLYRLLALPPEQFASANDALQTLQTSIKSTNKVQSTRPTVSQPPSLALPRFQFQDKRWWGMGAAAIAAGLAVIVGTGKVAIPGINLSSLPGLQALQSNNQSEWATLFPVEVEGSWGFINQQGEMVVSPQFDQVCLFSEGLAPVLVGDRYGYINADGEMAIPAQFQTEDSVHLCLERETSFSEGLVQIHQDGRWGYINREGKIVIAPQYDGADPFSEGLAPVQVGDRWGYINPDGDMVIPPQFDRAFTFFEGLAVVMQGEQYGYINTEGEIAIAIEFPIDFESFLQFDEELEELFFPILSHGIDTNFSDGLALIRSVTNSGYQYGYINTEGEIAINPQFVKAWPFHEGLALVRVDERYGYINTEGEMVINPQFDYALPFSEGMALVATNDTASYINTEGEMMIPRQFDLALPFWRGMAFVEVGDRQNYIDLAGNIVWENPSSWPLYPAAIQAEARTYIGSMNRAQQAYYSELSRFSSSFRDLGLGINPETENYIYRIDEVAPNQALMTATAKQQGLHSYVGIARAIRQARGWTTSVVICQTEQPSMNPPTDAPSGQGDPQCPPGTLDEAAVRAERGVSLVGTRLEVRLYVGLLNRAQQAYYLERGQFSSNLNNLETGMNSEAQHYIYSIDAVNQSQVWMTATAQRSRLPSYISIVWVDQMDDGNSTTRAMLCETNQPTTNPPSSSQFSVGNPECPAGTHPL
ncbi:MAG: WG repeat-containing protein [Leptolyngbyaceae bacterium]|nr:WG repeat-containing protein [Leptolyngbyaceae bacterium]